MRTEIMTKSVKLNRSLASLAACDASQEQKTYMLAKAAYETSKQFRNKEVEAIRHLAPSRDEIRRMVDANDPDLIDNHPYYSKVNDIEKRYHTMPLLKALNESEVLLIEWAKGNAHRAAAKIGLTVSPEVAGLFDKAPKLYGELREKFLDICIRMEVA